MPAKKYSPKKSSPKRSPIRSAVRTIEYTINEVDVEPSKQIFRVMNMLGYLFVLAALAAGIAWIYYVSQANAQDTLGDDSGAESVVTATTCFEGAVVGYLFYFVARHHFNNHY